MKVLIFRTYTIDCIPKVMSLEAAGYEVEEVLYDDRSHDRHHEFVEQARQSKPDFMVVIGALEEYHGRPVLRVDTYKKLREIAPLVLLCCDASDDPWWSRLEEWYKQECFTAIVGIDGGKSPIETFKNGLQLLSPIDHRPYVKYQKPWADRIGKFLFIGGVGGNRSNVVRGLMPDLMDHYQGSETRPYDEVARLYCERNGVVNCAWTGSGGRMHVKGRVIEAGFAGCLLFDNRGSPTGDWFVPDVEYFPYNDVAEIRHLLATTPDNIQCEMATRLHNKTVRDHHPAVFWNKVLAKIGFDV